MDLPPNSVLRVDVDVSITPGLPLETIPKGTSADDIAPEQLAQLCEDHFVTLD